MDQVSNRKRISKNDQNKIIQLLDEIIKEKYDDIKNIHNTRKIFSKIEERIKNKSEQKINIRDMFLKFNNKKRKRNNNEDNNISSKYHEKNEMDINHNNHYKIDYHEDCTSKNKCTYDGEFQKILEKYIEQIKCLLFYSFDNNKRLKMVLEKEKQKTKNLTNLISVKK